MADYIIDNGELRHYGVLGMKWGVRKNPSKAFAKSAKRYDRLKRRSDQDSVRSARLQKRGLRREELFGFRTWGKLTQYNAAMHATRAAKLDKKADRWVKRMEKNFAEVKVSDISPEHLEVGKKFAYMLLEDD